MATSPLDALERVVARDAMVSQVAAAIEDLIERLRGKSDSADFVPA
jgi:hypothetical protein